MGTDSGITVTALPQVLGATVRGLSVDKGLTADVVRRIHDAWYQHQVLFFPQLHLTEPQHIALGSVFGELSAVSPAKDDYRNLKKIGPNGEIFVLDSAEKRADVWHSDVSFTKAPPIGSILSMKVCPDKGGDTLWSNQHTAYDALSPAIKALVDSLQAEHYAVNHYGDAPRMIHRVTIYSPGAVSAAEGQQAH